MVSKVLFSSEKDDWETPQDLFDKLNEEFKFTLDPCCTHKTAKCKKYFTKEDDGLSKSWAGETVFCNPPYGKMIKKWIEKSYMESRNNKCKVVLLIPVRTDTKWFHEFCMDPIVVKSITFIKGRLKFGGQKNPAPFPSMVVEFCHPKKPPTIPNMLAMSNK